MRSSLAGVGEQAHPVGLCSRGDPHLTAIDYQVICTCKDTNLVSTKKFRNEFFFVRL